MSWRRSEQTSEKRGRVGQVQPTFRGVREKAAGVLTLLLDALKGVRQSELQESFRVTSFGENCGLVGCISRIGCCFWTHIPGRLTFRGGKRSRELVSESFLVLAPGSSRGLLE